MDLCELKDENNNSFNPKQYDLSQYNEEEEKIILESIDAINNKIYDL